MYNIVRIIPFDLLLLLNMNFGTYGPLNFQSTDMPNFLQFSTLGEKKYMHLLRPKGIVSYSIMYISQYTVFKKYICCNKLNASTCMFLQLI